MFGSPKKYQPVGAKFYIRAQGDTWLEFVPRMQYSSDRAGLMESGKMPEPIMDQEVEYIFNGIVDKPWLQTAHEM